jgi:cbb3-type cytochrome oxidase maturation protein
VGAADAALFATVIGSIVLFGGAAVLALGWAFRDGQFDNFDRGSKSIFGPDEPIGEPTDAFPGMASGERPSTNDGEARQRV